MKTRKVSGPLSPRPGLWLMKETFRQLRKMKSSTFSTVKPFVPASVIFPEAREDHTYLRRILADFDADDTIMLCAFLNQVINKPRQAHSVKQVSAVGGNLTKGEKIKIDKFAEQHGGMDNIYIITRAQLLYMIQLASQYCGKNDEFLFFSLKKRRAILQAIMASGKLVCDAIGLNRPLTATRPIEREDLAGPVRASQDLVSPDPDMMRSIARGTEIFLDCMASVKPEFASVFKEKTNISLENYFACLISLQVSYEASAESHFIYQYNHMSHNFKDRQTYKRFLELESCTSDSLREYVKRHSADSSQEDPIFLKAFRERPIFRAADNRATIIDPVFLYQKASVGPLFHMLGPDDAKNNEWFSAFGNAFERYATNILRRMYDSSSLLANRVLLKEKIIDYRGEILECDACLNDALDFVLFEAKAVILPDQAAVSDDPKAFVRVLEKKYGLSYDAEGKPVEKGVYQLAKFIDAVVLQASKGNPLYSNVKTIFPVLLVHDVALNSPITCEILQGYFHTALRLTGNGRFEYITSGPVHISPLIVMTIEDLEDLEYSITNFALTSLLKDYTMHSNTKPLSIRNFIYYSKYNHLLKINMGMLERAERYLMNAKEYLFFK